MLLTFVALATATALLMKNRPPLDRWLIVLSSIPIAVICNIVRIVLTGLVYVWGWNRIGDLVVHDLAGWLMMPLALGFIWIELKLIDWLCVVPIRIRKEEFMRANLVTEAYIRVRKDKPAPEPVAPLRPDGSRVGS
jgi:exosortase/archaeosortase family protein